MSRPAFRSIRGALLFWYATILTLTVAGFGGVLCHRQYRNLLDEADAELRSEVQGLAALDRTGLDPERLAARLPTDERRRFERRPEDAHYYAIWDASGQPLARSPHAPPLEFAALPPAEHPPKKADAKKVEKGEKAGGKAGPRKAEPASPDRKPRLYSRGLAREAVALGADDERVLVGAPLDKEWRRLGELAGFVAAAGAGVLLVALAGGWFLARQALAPIEQISQAAAAISASNLAQRIPVEQTQTELGRLAMLLNGAFDRLEAAFTDQARFTADASHELRTPLAVLRAQIDLALRRERSPDEYRSAFDVCRRAAERMERVVAGLLTLARADAGELRLAREPVDLRDVVGETASLLQPLAAERGVTLETTLPSEPCVVLGDRDRLAEVVVNLAANAVQYNRPQGRVELRVTAAADSIALEAADTGVGIAAEALPQIGGRFFRVDAARSTDSGGVGLGLAIVQRLLEAHGAQFSITSRQAPAVPTGEALAGAVSPPAEQDAGTRVTVRFPRWAGSAAPSASQSQEIAGP